MIRPEQLEELRQQIAKDEQLVAELRLRRFVGSGEAYSKAKGRIALAQDVLTDLTAQYEVEQKAIADRPNVEKAEAKYLDGAARALGKADARLKTALEAAQAALSEVVDATKDRGALIEQTAKEMATRGLTLHAEDGAPAYDTGTSSRLGGEVVRIRRQWWKPLAPLDLLDWLQHRVQAARMPGYYAAPFCGTCHQVEGRDDFAVSDVAAPAHVKPPELPRVERASMPQALTFIHSVSEAERQIDKEELQWTTVMARVEDGEAVWERMAPTDQMKERAAYRKKQLRDSIAAGRIIVGH
ncbi:hypothetical protein AB0F77_20915 [Streptomyces sp. NPDC026672]|uniref:hypothetical protein n=1 Tax=unclassified Streptomyces TaxID=2593676 RepID=UPI0033CED265